jgi:hypothetical protein
VQGAAVSHGPVGPLVLYCQLSVGVVPPSRRTLAVQAIVA